MNKEVPVKYGRIGLEKEPVYILHISWCQTSSLKSESQLLRL